MWTVIFIAVIIPVLTIEASDERNFGHERVIENILQNYKKAQYLVRPAQNTSVFIGLKLPYIKSFHSGNGKLTAGYWIAQSWQDSRLKWQDSSVASINLPSDLIWRPDWRLYNGLHYEENIDHSPFPVITLDGTVVYVPTAEFTTVCTPVADDNAWDCGIKIGSWTHNAHQMPHHFMDEKSAFIDTSFFDEEMYGFKVEAQRGTIETKIYDCCPDPYQHALFRFRLRIIEGGVASGTAAFLPSVISFVLCLVFSVL